MVREGHAREREPRVGAGVHLVGKAVGTADDDDEPFRAAVEALLEPERELHGALLLAPLVEQRHEIALRKLTHEGFAFGRALLFDGEASRVPHVGQHGDAELAVAVHAPRIERDERFDLFRIGLADDDQFDLHGSGSVLRGFGFLVSAGSDTGVTGPNSTRPQRRRRARGVPVRRI